MRTRRISRNATYIIHYWMEAIWVFGFKARFHVYDFCFYFLFFFNGYCNITLIYCTKDKMRCLYTVHGSHNTIHTFKNYFVIVFSVFSFSKNKLYPNESLMYKIKECWQIFDFFVVKPNLINIHYWKKIK